MSDYRDLDWYHFTGHMFSKKELDEIYEQGRADRDKELAEHNVFCSNRPIEDLVFDAITEERERIVRELEEMKTIDGSMKTKLCIKFDEMTVNRAIVIVRGGTDD